MISERIARRYVAALFGLAHEAGVADQVGVTLHEVQQMYRLHARLRNALSDPRLPHDKKRAVLLRLMGPDAPPLLARFADLLIEKHRLGVLHHAGTIFARLQDEAAGIRHAEVRSALPLSDEQHLRLQEALSDLLGLRIVLSARVDPAVIAGVSVRVGDLLIDGSVRGRLEGLRQEFQRTETAALG